MSTIRDRADWAALTPEEQNEAVRKYTKWLCRNCRELQCVGCDYDDYPQNVRPDYLGDLNAMHHAEKIIIEAGLKLEYMNHIYWTTKHLSYTTWRLCHATAAERALAFVLTMGREMRGGTSMDNPDKPA